MTELIKPADVSQSPRTLRRMPFRSSAESVRLTAVLLAAGYAVQLAFRLILSIGRLGPINIADEIGYLLNARLVAGGVPGQMAGTTFYRGGYSLLIAPAYLFTDNPRVSYNLVLGINALISAAVFPLLYYLLSRIFSIKTYPALAISFIAALYPPLVLNSLLAWSESALYALMLLTCIFLGKMVSAQTNSARWKWSVAAGLITGFLYTTHGRMAPVVALLVVIFVVIAILRRDLRFPALAAIGIAGISLVIGELLNGYLVQNIWGESSGSEASNVIDNLGKSGIVQGAATVAVGQYWYLIVGSFGLFGLGIFALCRFLRTEPDESTSTGFLNSIRARFAPATNGSAIVAIFLLLSVLSLMFLAAVFLFPIQRPDQVVYGRYCEVVAPIFVALGLHRLWSRYPNIKIYRDFVVIFGLVGLSYFAFRHYRNDLVFGKISNSYTTLTLPWLSKSISGLHPRHVMVVAAVIGAVLVFLRFRRARVIGFAGLAVLLVYSSFSTRQVLFPVTQRAIYGPNSSNVVPDTQITTPQNIGYDNGYYSVESRFAFQWLLNDAHFVLFNSKKGEQPTTRYVISSIEWPQASQQHAKLLWREGIGRIGLWEIPSNPIQAPK